VRIVGLRELKNRLSRCIRYVRAGHAVTGTDRGQVVAELRPPSELPIGSWVDSAIAQLANRGLLVVGARNSASVYPRLRPLLGATSAQELLDADRGVR
jgi:antitoxin (DNA-binding transcriptional repressor) of toxin-antitoxin stability system